MENQRTETRLERYRPDCTRFIEDYLPFIGRERMEEIRRLADPLAGTGWTQVNSTFQGGGVAEMLRSLVPLAKSLGLDARWYAIHGHDGFFKVTKKFHNMLQGADHSISLEEIFGDYLANIEENARNTHIASDLIVVHDPQPAALILKGVLYGHVLWRCHIDTSRPDPRVWNFLLPYINHCAGAVFTMPEFVGPGIQVPVYQIMPGIDPLAEKNRPYTDAEALDILSPLFHRHDVEPGRPILAAVSRYDVHKNQAAILEAFRLFRQEKRTAAEPYLIFVGNTATDDPEGGAVLRSLQEEAAGDPDVRFLVNVEDNDRVVGALMRKAAALVHVSTREGFGLVVAEALWQGTPVIGSRVGGIVEQVIDGDTGFRVNPTDVHAIARSMSRILDDPEEAEVLGRQGREHVRRHFLLPEIMRRYLILLHHFKGIDRMKPGFRLNGLSYGEYQGLLRAKHLQQGLASLGSLAS